MIDQNGLRDRYGEDLTNSLSAIGLTLYGRWEEISRNRSAVEERWLTDLRQFRGIYEPDEEKNIQKNRSKTFVRMTRTKVKAVTDRLMEMLFPANDEKNWDIKTTPRPDVAMTPMAAQMLQIAQVQYAQQQLAAAEEAGEQLQNQSQLVMPEEMKAEVLKQAAKLACENMRQEIDDQLSEIRHRDICEKVVHDGNLYGTGILKAPLVQERKKKSWVAKEDGSWEMTLEPQLLPYEEHVSLWDFYPDDNACELDDCEIFFQFHRKSRHQLAELMHQPGFKEFATDIAAYLKQFPEGASDVRSFESEKSVSNADNDSKKQVPDRRYALLECWAPLSGSDLMEAGVSEEMLTDEGLTAESEPVWCNIWMLGPFVVKVAIDPLPGRDHPYHIYYYDKDETSIWGSGLSEIMRDDQKGVNSVTRAMMDNMAVTVGPQWEINLDMLEPGEKAGDIYPGRKWLRRGEGRDPALRAIQVDSRLAEFMSVRKMYVDQIHENTVPSYMHGDSDKGVGRTVGGLSMLMGAANINIKGLVRNFDDGITTPAIRGMYYWNMAFNPREDIKGDYEVVAVGSSSLVAKELRVQHLDFALNASNNPEDAAIIDRRKLWDERMKASDIGGMEIVRSEDEYNKVKSLTNQNQMLAQENQLLKTAVQKAREVAPGVMSDVLGDIANAG